MRTVFSVIIATDGDRAGAARIVLRMSDFDSGEPVTTVRPGREARILEVRTRATAV